MDGFNFISGNNNEKDDDEKMCENIMETFADLSEEKQTEFINKIVEGKLSQGIIFGVDDKTFTLNEIVDKFGVDFARQLLVKVSKGKKVIASKDPEVTEAVNALIKGEATKEQKELLLKKAGYTDDKKIPDPSEYFFPDSEQITEMVTSILCGMDINRKHDNDSCKMADLMNAILVVSTLNAVKQDNSKLSGLGPADCSKEMVEPVMDLVKYLYQSIDKGTDIHTLIAVLMAAAVKLSEIGKIEFKLDDIMNEFGLDFNIERESDPINTLLNSSDNDDDDEEEDDKKECEEHKPDVRSRMMDF